MTPLFTIYPLVATASVVEARNSALTDCVPAVKCDVFPDAAVVCKDS